LWLHARGCSTIPSGSGGDQTKCVILGIVVLGRRACRGCVTNNTRRLQFRHGQNPQQPSDDCVDGQTLPSSRDKKKLPSFFVRPASSNLQGKTAGRSSSSESINILAEARSNFASLRWEANPNAWGAVRNIRFAEVSPSRCLQQEEKNRQVGERYSHRRLPARRQWPIAHRARQGLWLLPPTPRREKPGKHSIAPLPRVIAQPEQTPPFAERRPCFAATIERGQQKHGPASRQAVIQRTHAAARASGTGDSLHLAPPTDFRAGWFKKGLTRIGYQW